MVNWTGFSLRVVFVVMGLGMGGCTEDPSEVTNTGNETTGMVTSTTSSTGVMPPVTGSTTTGSTTTAGQEDTTLETTQGPTGSSTVAATDSTGTTGPTGTGTTGTGTTGTGTTEMGTSSGGSTSTGDPGYEGMYDGTWEGTCPGVGMVNGTFAFDVAMDGTVMGMMMGFDTGPMSGTVDPMGVVDIDVMAAANGLCPWDGQIDMMGNVTGMWTCPGALCDGTFMGSIQP